MDLINAHSWPSALITDFVIASTTTTLKDVRDGQ
jgi:hypothetical protein